jgi:hypothetical protein
MENSQRHTLLCREGARGHLFHFFSPHYFQRLSRYSLAPCTLLLAPFETEQAQLAKVELLKPAFLTVKVRKNKGMGKT